MKTHLDGARLWNAAAESGISEKELAAPFDSVSVCFSKGLGAPVGSAIAGSEEFILEARRNRKLFGGAMRQAGIIAAGALHAVQNHRHRLTEDHAHARQLGEAVSACDGFEIRGGNVETNMLMFEIASGRGSAADFVQQLREQGIWCFPISAQAVRLVTHFGCFERSHRPGLVRSFSRLLPGLAHRLCNARRRDSTLGLGQGSTGKRIRRRRCRSLPCAIVLRKFLGR